MWFKVKKTLFSSNCTLFLLLYPRLSETHRFLQSSSLWEARCALIGQLSSALWLAEYLKHVTEMLRPLPYFDAVPPCDNTKKIKPIINEVFVASDGDIITYYNGVYCLFTRRVASRRVNITMSAFVIGETTNSTLHCSKLAFQSSVANSLNKNMYFQAEIQKSQTILAKLELRHFIETAFEHSCQAPPRFRKQSSVKCSAHTLIFGLNCSGTVL